MDYGLMIAWLHALSDENEDPDIDYSLNVIIDYLDRKLGDEE